MHGEEHEQSVAGRARAGSEAQALDGHLETKGHLSAHWALGTHVQSSDKEDLSCVRLMGYQEGIPTLFSFSVELFQDGPGQCVH